MKSRRMRNLDLVSNFIGSDLNLDTIQLMQKMTPHEKFEVIMILIHTMAHSMEKITKATRHNSEAIISTSKSAKKIARRARVADLKVSALANYLSRNHHEVDFDEVNLLLAVLMRQNGLLQTKNTDEPKPEKAPVPEKAKTERTDEDLVNDLMSFSKKKPGDTKSGSV